MAIYILSDPFAARIKIGYTNNLQRRIKTHLTSNPGLVVLATMEMGDRATEKALHRVLRGHRCSGTAEWYRDSPVARKVLGEILERLGC